MLHRKEFERFCRDRGMSTMKYTKLSACKRGLMEGTYINEHVRFAWEAWKHCEEFGMEDDELQWLMDVQQELEEKMEVRDGDEK